MATLTDEIAFYDEHRAELEADHFGQWVLIHDRAVQGYFDSFHEAAADAVHKFGRGPYLIRQVGASAVNLSSSVMYGPMRHVHHTLRV